MTRTFIVNQLNNLLTSNQRIGMNIKRSVRFLNQINPIEHRISLAYTYKIRSRLRIGYYNRLRTRRNRHSTRLTPAIVEHIAKNTARFDGLNSSTAVAFEIKDNFGVVISPKSVRRIRRRHGFRRRRSANKPYLSVDTKQKRFKYCLNHRNDHFYNYIFCDESVLVKL